ncbi:dihydrofolate reductase family protein [Parabacteroides chinchillae]|uniref:RibD C-terminal domain-containing protein n=1 Tax=Parabacteroides chinchillae TaxID=871327 RepID=A0A8G2BWZ5_9BACT|nr:dihydrofolate reductase family protein [Parabacteroides chinchillae]SEF96263.1 RibD C-terminal domain-containing protein [Parabacteroides chinchillae]
MAKVQLLTVQSIDGYMIDNYNELPAVLSDEIEKLKDAAIRQLNENISLSMLIDWRENEPDRFTYLIEATKETRSIINGMFRMHLIDEIVRYTIPVMLGTGVSLYQQELPKNNWKVVKTASYKDDMSLTVFRKIKQDLLK